MGDAVNLIEQKAAVSVLRRPLQLGEVSNSVANAYSDSYNTEPKTLKRFKYEPPSPGERWPAKMHTPQPSMRDDEAISNALEIVGFWFLPDIREASPVPTDGRHSEDLLAMLFDPDDLLCIGTVTRFRVKSMREWRLQGMRGEQIVPNPNKSKVGRTRNGHLSGHCRDAVGLRKYLVIEFDDESLSPEQQCGLLRFLKNRAGGKLKMVVDSGGKSFHGWFAANKDDHLNWKFMNLAVRLGADPRMWLPEQFARTPNAERSNGRIQHCCYLEPKS